MYLLQPSKTPLLLSVLLIKGTVELSSPKFMYESELNYKQLIQDLEKSVSNLKSDKPV